MNNLKYHNLNECIFKNTNGKVIIVVLYWHIVNDSHMYALNTFNKWFSMMQIAYFYNIIFVC